MYRDQETILDVLPWEHPLFFFESESPISLEAAKQVRSVPVPS